MIRSDLWTVEVDHLDLLRKQIEDSISLHRDVRDSKDAHILKVSNKLRKQILHLVEQNCLLIFDLHNGTDDTIVKSHNFQKFEEEFGNSRKEWLQYLGKLFLTFLFPLTKKLLSDIWKRQSTWRKKLKTFRQW